MPRTHVKAAQRLEPGATTELTQRVSDLLSGIQAGGEQAAMDLAAEYDDWRGPIVVERDTIAAAARDLPTTAVDDIRTAHQEPELRVRVGLNL